MIKTIFSEKRCKSTLIVLALAFSPLITAGQPTADFATNRNAGCSPLLVQFINNSVGQGTLSYHWDFGNGNFSYLRNPSATYIHPGSYIVTLTVSDINGEVADTKVITVFENPVAGFSIEADIGCLPFSCQFQNNSVEGDAVITKYTWDFGDGSTSQVKNPTHLYEVAGNLPVLLEVTDANNCKSYMHKSGAVSVLAKPDVDFSLSHSVYCDTPVVALFTNLSLDQENLSFNWSFGDGEYSQNPNPGHTYSNDGFYTVKLIAIDLNGCTTSKEISEMVEVVSKIGKFMLGDDTICRNTQVVVEEISPRADTYHWEFGDGRTSQEANPDISYPGSGSYIITLISEIDNQCTSSASDTIVVEEITADFMSSDHYACSLPFGVEFTDLSVNAVDWEWHMGTGNIYYIQNPLQEYNMTNYPENDLVVNFNDTLIAISSHGCRDTVIKQNNMQVILPTARFYPISPSVGYNTQISGCIPKTVNFSNASSYLSENDNIVNWQWSFGDGTFSNETSPLKIFEIVGDYTINLTVTTSLGCVSSTSTQAYLGFPQVADFQLATAPSTCASDPFGFQDLSTNQALIDQWYWSFSDGSMAFSPNPGVLSQDTGYISASLIVSYNNCHSEPKKFDSIVHVKAPLGIFDKDMDCTNPYEYSFEGILMGANEFQWDFGDSSPFLNSEESVSHIYQQTGDYLVSLTCENYASGCSYAYVKKAMVRELHAHLVSSQAVGCPGLDVQLDPSGSEDNSQLHITGQGYRKFGWFVNDVHDGFSNIGRSYTFDSVGVFNLQVIAIDTNGCTDEASSTIKIYEPLADFTADTIAGCSPFNPVLSESVTSDTTYSVSWLINDVPSGGEESIYPALLEAGKYVVTIIAKDILGCADTLTRTDYLFVADPSANFLANRTKICVNDKVQFTSQESTIQNYFWNFGEGYILDNQTVEYTFNDSGTYTVSLVVKDLFGCFDTVILPDLINVQSYPEASFTIDTGYANCYPVQINFTCTSTSETINSWDWDFGDYQSISEIQNPEHGYSHPGEFTVRLIVKTSNGCRDSIVKNSIIKVDGPIAEIAVNDTVCKFEPIDFVLANGKNLYDFSWDFGDGVVGEGDTSIHSYEIVGTIFPRLLLYSDSVHTCDKYIEDSVYVVEMASGFSINNKNFCRPFFLDATNLMYGADSFKWMVNGQEQYGDVPYYSSNMPGFVDITLEIFNNFGCVDSTRKTFSVFDLPAITASPDTIICYGDDIEIRASGGKSYFWSPEGFVSNPWSPTTYAAPERTTMFVVNVTDSNECINTDSVLIRVQQVPEFIISNDTTVIIGELAYPYVTAEENYLFTWTPASGLSCTTCQYPTVDTLESQIYTVTTSDTNSCFKVSDDMAITVREAYTVGLPSAFSPNNDNINDVVYVRGWGIKNLIELRIYNQWGEMIFESEDMSQGWDGTYKGKLQPIDTYAYTVKIETYDGQILSGHGDINLLR